jgi:hypothetical protein
MRERNLSGLVIEQLKGHELKTFADQVAWLQHLDQLGISQLQVHPNPIKIATELDFGHFIPRRRERLPCGSR